jgi:hypothetical protein
MALRTLLGCGVLAIALASGCAASVKAPPADAATGYQAGITYSLSAAMLKQLAQAGQDVKLTINLQSGASGSIANCTLQPVAPFASRPSLSASAANRLW